MKKSIIKQGEKERIAALKELNILGSSSEPQYDDITELAAYICDKPVGLISLFDEDRVWFKSKVGTTLEEIKIKDSFFAQANHTVGEVSEICDTHSDKRFKNNSIAHSTERRPIRFYAGYPIINAEGFIFGTLCVVDYKPNKLNRQQKKALETLGEQVARLFELHLKNNILTKSEHTLTEHNALLKNFAGAVSHDLKMPLASVTMTIDLIKKKYASVLDKDGVEYLNRLKQSAFGMGDYISNILAYYEAENISSEDYSEEPFGLKEFLEDIIDMLNIEEDCEINLPDNNFDLVCNRSGLEQIFLNLLGNSLKYNDKDKAVIHIKSEKGKQFYKFEITDNGMGIPKDQQDKIFNLFTTVIEKDRYGKKGSGIGLSTVKNLVDKLGGNIQVDSNSGEFTTFSFTIEKQKPKTNSAKK